MASTAYGGYGVFANDLTPYVNQAIQQAVLTGSGYARQQAVAAVVTAVESTTAITSKQLAEFADLVKQGVAREERAALHERIARQAQLSTLRSFDQTARRTNQQPGYRSGPGSKWRRYSGGRLRAALADQSFVHADADGIDFGNVALLDKRAAQWARLNFGAGPDGTGSKAPVNVTINSVAVAALGLEEPARPGFSIPVGYFVGPEGFPIAPSASKPGVAFYPAGTGDRRFRGRMYTTPSGDRRPIPRTRRRPTRGIRSRNFLDAGVARIAREIGPGYEALYRDLVRRGEAKVKPRRWNITARRGVRR